MLACSSHCTPHTSSVTVSGCDTLWAAAFVVHVQLNSCHQMLANILSLSVPHLCVCSSACVTLQGFVGECGRRGGYMEVCSGIRICVVLAIWHIVCGDVGREVIRLTHFQGQSQGQGPCLLLTPYTHGVPHVDCEGPCAVTRTNQWHIGATRQY
jgi:hypothetical protein